MHLPPIRAGALAVFWFWKPRSPAFAQRFFRADLARPPSAGSDRRIPLQRVGRPGPAQGDGLEGAYCARPAQGLYITGAWFKRDLGEDWIKILNDARIAELFVPYHSPAASAITT